MSHSAANRQVGMIAFAAIVACSVTTLAFGQSWKKLSGRSSTIAKAAKKSGQIAVVQQPNKAKVNSPNHQVVPHVDTDALRKAMAAHQRHQRNQARAATGHTNTDALRRVVAERQRSQSMRTRVIPGHQNADAFRQAMEAYRQNQDAQAHLIPTHRNADAFRHALDAHRRREAIQQQGAVQQVDPIAVRRIMDAQQRLRGGSTQTVAGLADRAALRRAMEAMQRNTGDRVEVRPGTINVEAVRRAIAARAAARRAEEETASAEVTGRDGLDEEDAAEPPETGDPIDWPASEDATDWHEAAEAGDWSEADDWSESEEPGDWAASDPYSDGAWDDDVIGGHSGTGTGIDLARDIINLIRNLRSCRGGYDVGDYDNAYDSGGYSGGALDDNDFDQSSYQDSGYEDTESDVPFTEDERGDADFDRDDVNDEAYDEVGVIDDAEEDAEVDVPQNELPSVGEPEEQKLIILLNPQSTGAAISCLLDGKQLTLEAGDCVDRVTNAPILMKFHRGGEFGTLECNLVEGIYEFRTGDECWDLRRRTFGITIDNSQNDKDFKLTINDQAVAVTAGEILEHKDRFPMDLVFDQGDGKKQSLTGIVAGNYAVQLDPNKQLISLAEVPAQEESGRNR